LLWDTGLQFYIDENAPPFSDYRNTLAELRPALDEYADLTWASADGSYMLYRLRR